jgi:hypothetical protein
VTLDQSTSKKISQLDDAGLENLFECNRERIQRLLADAAGVRVEQASIRAEMKRREWETWS